MNLDTTALPTSLGARLVLSLTAAAVARAVSEPDVMTAAGDGNGDGGDTAAAASAAAALAVVRWAVAVRAALPAEGTDAADTGPGGGAVARRVQCAADGCRLPAETYSRAFCAQQLAVRLAAAAAASLPRASEGVAGGAPPLLAGADGPALRAALVQSAVALRRHDAASDLFPAARGAGALSAVADELAGLVLDVAAAVATAADRHATAGAAPLRCGDTAARLASLCAQLAPPAPAAGSARAGAGTARGSGAALAGTLVGGLFEAAPSREGTSAAATLRATCPALFDRAASTWRGGRAGARTQVEASMAAAQAAPLVGMAASSNGGAEEEEDEVEEGDEEEEEEEDDDDDGLMDVIAPGDVDD